MNEFIIKIITVKDTTNWITYNTETIIGSILLGDNIADDMSMLFANEEEWKKAIVTTVSVNHCFMIDQKETVCTLYCAQTDRF